MVAATCWVESSAANVHDKETPLLLGSATASLTGAGHPAGPIGSCEVSAVGVALPLGPSLGDVSVGEALIDGAVDDDGDGDCEGVAERDLSLDGEGLGVGTLDAASGDGVPSSVATGSLAFGSSVTSAVSGCGSVASLIVRSDGTEADSVCCGDAVTVGASDSAGASDGRARVSASASVRAEGEEEESRSTVGEVDGDDSASTSTTHSSGNASTRLTVIGVVSSAARAGVTCTSEPASRPTVMTTPINPRLSMEAIVKGSSRGTDVSDGFP